jgi:hypothetical protein
LDLTIQITQLGTVITDLYEKPNNLYLYLPAHTNHPTGIIRGLIFESLIRIYRLTSQPEMRIRHIKNLFHCLLARGHNKQNVIKIINEAKQRYDKTSSWTSNKTSTDENRIYFHIPYHSMDPPSNTVQEIFRRELQFPRGLTPLHNLKNHKNAAIGITRLIVAYHRPPNSGNLLSPQLMKAEQRPAVSSYLD